MKRVFFVLMLMMLCVGTLTFAIKIQPARSAGTLQGAQVDWWPMFHHDLTHSGDSSSTAPRTNQTLWSFNTGRGVTASPTIADGVVYIGSWNNNTYALNASRGALIWNYTTGDSIVFSSAAVSNGVVYVGSGDGFVYAFNASTGTLLWNCKIGDLVWSSAAVENGMVYVGSGSSTVDALNASNGALVWSYYTGDEVVSSPAIDNGVVFIGSLNGNVYALNAMDGAYIWSYQTGSYVTSSPAVTSGIVYISTDGSGNVEKGSNIYALNASTGALLWSYPTGGFSSPAVANGLVYAGGSDEKLYALNATTGVYVWSYMTGEPSSPAVAGGLVFVGDANYGKVYALDAFTGALIWSYQTGGSVTSSPAVCGGAVFIGSGDGNVYAFDQPPFSVSVSPVSVGMTVGSSQLFNSSIAGGAPPYMYQWYLNGAPVSGATNPTWTFTPDSAGSYSVNVEVTDASSAVATSNTVSVTASEPGNIGPPNGTQAAIVVPDDYSTIQAAINAANAGDIIYVRDGIYHEHIEVNKTVTLMGESKQNTIIEAYEAVPPFCGIRITASNVTVEDFNITGACSLGAGVVFVDASGSGSSSFNVIRNNDIATAVEGTSDTLDIMGGGGNIVEGNQIMVRSGSSSGIGVAAYNNTVNDNAIIGGWTCIAILLGNDNTVSNNYVAGQTLTGGFSDVGAIDLEVTFGDVVIGNTLFNNSIALSVYAGNCSVYHNNFINNTQQVLTESGSQVTFDNGYPSGGNYWSDYTGTDAYSGPGQNITGSDGIGDTAYVINGSNVDHYPFVSPVNTLVADPPHILGDINGDGKVGLDDLVILASAYGSRPGDAKWNPNADLDGNGVVGLSDLVSLANHYGQHIL